MPENRHARGRSLLAVSMLVAMFMATGGGIAEATGYSPDNPFISGVKPDRRPEGAPVLEEYPKDAGWYERALTGIRPPYPYSLRFLEDQGAWYTPFIHPGMLPPYDIRGWFGKSGTSATDGKRQKSGK